MNLNKFVKKQSQESTECNDPPKIDFKSYKNNDLFIVSSHSCYSFADLDTADYDEEFKYKSEPQTSSTKVSKPSAITDDIQDFELKIHKTAKNELEKFLLGDTQENKDNFHISNNISNEEKGENKVDNLHIESPIKKKEEENFIVSGSKQGGVQNEKNNNENGNEINLSYLSTISPILKNKKASLMKKRVSFNEKVYVYDGQINPEKSHIPLRAAKKKKNCGCRFY